MKTTNNKNRTKTKHISSLPALCLAELRQWHVKRTITQKELSMAAGVAVETIRRLEARHTLPPDLEAVLRIALAFGCTIDDLMSPELAAGMRRSILVRRIRLGIMPTPIDLSGRSDRYEK